MTRWIVIFVVAWAARAHAYPRYQLGQEPTCSGCHLSPAGGGLLNENGLAAAERLSQWGTAPEFLNGLVTTPSWLELGGDLRGAAGWTRRYDARGAKGALVDFPMQADVYAAATFDAFSLHATVGGRDPQYNGSQLTVLASREHWLQWQQDPGAPDGLFVRVGRFMPVYGLRFVEHTAYDRAYGGTPLYGEAYGAAVEYVEPAWEVHATAFVHDPLQGSVELGDGAAVYGEARITRATAVGIESKLDVTADDRKLYGGVTAKHYVASPELMVQGELELVHQKIDAGGTDNQLVGYVLATYFVGAVMIDVGVGVDDANLALRYLDQEAADVDVHWVATSHVELLLTNRLQMLELGAGGQSSGYSLLQLHYRL
ncbi:MAG: hypothetical protein ACM31C_04860 [Acidobacteriota bacterium]